MSLPTLASLPVSPPSRGTAGTSGARRDPSDQDAGAAGGFAAALEAATSGGRSPGRPAATDELAAAGPGTADAEAATEAAAGSTSTADAAPVVAPPVLTSPDQPSVPSPASEPATPPPAATSGSAVVDGSAPVVGTGPVAAEAVPSAEGTSAPAVTAPPALGATVQDAVRPAGATSDGGATGGALQDGQDARSELPAAATPSDPQPTGATTSTSAATTTSKEPQQVSQPAPATGPAAPPAAAAVRTLDAGQSPAAPTGPHPPVPTPLATQLAPRVGSLRALGEGVHRLVMRVQPEEIGSVRVVAEITSDRVRIELHGGTEQAREALRAALPDLRRDLLGTDPPGTRAELDLGSAGRQAGRDRDRPRTPGDPPGADGASAPVQLVLPRAAAGRLDVVT